VINRIAAGQAQVDLGPYGAGAWRPETTLRDPAFCRANDLAFRGDNEALGITIDRGACQMAIADYMPGARTGRVMAYQRGVVSEAQAQLTFPNGIEGDWIAETRGHRLRGADGREIGLPGGPDNLTRTEDGALIAAVHPKLAQLGLYLNDWAGRAPSRIVRIAPETGVVEVLFDDPAGAVFSAATAAVLTDGHLIAGSVRDAGLLLCGPAR
jgi:hypothetical protein